MGCSLIKKKKSNKKKCVMKIEKESDMLLHLPIIVVCTENDSTRI